MVHALYSMAAQEKLFGVQWRTASISHRALVYTRRQKNSLTVCEHGHQHLNFSLTVHCHKCHYSLITRHKKSFWCFATPCWSITEMNSQIRWTCYKSISFIHLAADRPSGILGISWWALVTNGAPRLWDSNQEGTWIFFFFSAQTSKIFQVLIKFSDLSIFSIKEILKNIRSVIIGSLCWTRGFEREGSWSEWREEEQTWPLEIVEWYTRDRKKSSLNPAV